MLRIDKVLQRKGWQDRLSLPPRRRLSQKLRFFDLADGKSAGEWKAPDRVPSLCVSGDAQTLYVETEGATWLRLDGKGAASPAPKLPAKCPRFFGNGGFMPGQSPCQSTDYRGNRLPYTPPSPADGVHIRDFSAGVCATDGQLGLLLGRSNGAGSQHAALAAVDLVHPEKPLWRLDLVERTLEFSIKGESGVAIVAGRGIVYFVQGETAFLQAYDLNSGQLLWSQPMPLS